MLGEIAPPADDETVEHATRGLPQQPVDQVAPDEAGAAGDKVEHELGLRSAAWI